MWLDPTSIAERRVSLEEANIRVQAAGNFICHFCNKRFKGETMFMKHHCEQKRKQQEEAVAAALRHLNPTIRVHTEELWQQQVLHVQCTQLTHPAPPSPSHVLEG